MDLVGHKPCIPCSGSIKMQAEYPKNLLYPDSHSREDAVPSLLSTTQASVAPGLDQDPVKLSFLTIFLLERVFVISLVRKYGLLMALDKLIHHLRIMHIGRRANKFRDKLRLGIHRYVIFVAINGLFALFGEGSIVIFAGLSSRFDQTSINDFASFEFKAFLAYLALELIEAAAVEVHGFEVGAEAGNGGIIGDRINSRKAKEAAVEEVPFEHEFHFGVGMAVDLLDDEDFEHHNGIVGFTANLGGMQRTKDLLERFPIDEFIDASEDVFWKILVYEVFTYGELAAIFLEH